MRSTTLARAVFLCVGRMRIERMVLRQGRPFVAVGTWRLDGRRVIALGSSFLFGCSAPMNAPADGTAAASSTPAEKTGSIGLQVQVAPGVMLATVSYTLSGPESFHQSGTIDVSNSLTIQALLGGLPAGSGYAASLSGVSTDGSVTCAGSSVPFSVQSDATTAVSVLMACAEPVPNTGAIVVAATPLSCPTIDGLSALPRNVFVGGSLGLAVAARGLNRSALSYSWTASSGNLTNASSAYATFTCTLAGTPTITVTVSDGSDAPNCFAAQSVTVTCAAPDGGSAAADAGAGG